jgi:hypothetical protein
LREASLTQDIKLTIIQLYWQDNQNIKPGYLPLTLHQYFRKINHQKESFDYSLTSSKQYFSDVQDESKIMICKYNYCAVESPSYKTTPLIRPLLTKDTRLIKPDFRCKIKGNSKTNVLIEQS